MPPEPTLTTELHHGVLIRKRFREQDLTIVNDVVRDDCYRVTDLPKPTLTVVDIGAHIGSFAVHIKRHRPEAHIVCVEANRRNLHMLNKNVGRFATIHGAACGYDHPVKVLSTVHHGSPTTGGSFVSEVDDESWRELHNRNEYVPESDLVEPITLEQICQHPTTSRCRTSWGHIDLLKLDCEGSEFPILERTTMLDRIGCIVGEWHDRERFMRMVDSERFAKFTLDVLRDGELGLFRLSRGDWWNMD